MPSHTAVSTLSPAAEAYHTEGKTGIAYTQIVLLYGYSFSTVWVEYISVSVC